MKINVMIISKMERNIVAIRDMIEDEEIILAGDSTTGSTALDKIENIGPDIIIMALGSGDTDVLNLAERIILHRPRTHVILLTEFTDINILQSAISVGAHNVREFPETKKEFAEYIKSVYNNETTRINSLSQQENLTWMSRVITLFGAKGGLGKTTIAVNLAVRLAQQHKKVVLVDLDLQFGDIHIFLDIEPKDTVAELMQEFFNSSIDSVRSFMTLHSSGVHVLCAPKSPEYAEVISAEKVQSLISLLRSYYDYVIIDTAPDYNEVTINALESSTSILFVTGQDISILKNSKLSLAILDSLRQSDKIKLVVNRAMDMNSITLDDVQRILNCPIWARVPSDYKTAVSALNRGVPFVVGSPTSDLAGAIDVIAHSLQTGEDIVRDRSGKKIQKKKALKGLFKR